MSAGCISSSNLNLITLRCGSDFVISGSAAFGSGSIISVLGSVTSGSVIAGSGSIISVVGSVISGSCSATSGSATFGSGSVTSGSVIAGSGSIISGSGMLSPNALAKSLSLSSKNSSSNKAKSN